jgi:hypothetical protein
MRMWRRKPRRSRRGASDHAMQVGMIAQHRSTGLGEASNSIVNLLT